MPRHQQFRSVGGQGSGPFFARTVRYVTQAPEPAARAVERTALGDGYSRSARTARRAKREDRPLC
jgi:hypothetical protein